MNVSKLFDLACWITEEIKNKGVVLQSGCTYKLVCI